MDSFSYKAMTMHKTQVFIREDQRNTLQNLSRMTGKKQSALIREGIDWYTQKIMANQIWRTNLHNLAGSLSEEEAENMKSDIEASRRDWVNRQ